jgi:hypothetical protein
MKKIQLTNEFQVGDFGSDNYTHAQIDRVHLDLVGERVVIEVSLGYFDGELNWVPADKVTGVTSKHISLPKSELGPLLPDAKVFVDALVQKLVDDGEFDGTAVE